jgi:tetratricopeptide (TPR) repeat protein
MRWMPLRLVALGVVLTTGCASQKAAQKPAPREPEKTVKLEPVKVVANQPDTPDALEFYDAETLFKRGQEFLDSRYYTDARKYFQKLLDEFPDSAYAHDTHYNLGVALLESGDAASALGHFETYLSSEKDAKNLLDGSFKKGACLAMLGRYPEVVDLFDGILRTQDLERGDRIEALVDAGIAHFMTGDHATAEHRFQEAVKLHKSVEKESRVENSYFYAQSLFYLAEIERHEFSAFKFKFFFKGGEEKLVL